ncbi:PepSY domain-containing protein [Allopusillimonas soli]|uniref:PepSY domain-containing protein n=1 Tax=Allopusillimonas soli TaxID=659016 RepID=A0A853F7E8_9BURK|nr:PepSY domain-containing protein [Allopusillimonas soli]NYT35899.1 PepSY domain-containing protein [Allopusillimonas soli]TEA76260.1 PepSY domain-containing protein [Allopusillimonas soli]
MNPKSSTIRVWRAVHTWSSVAATMFLLLLCITGLPLIFHEEIEHWQEPDMHAEGKADPTLAIDAMVTQALAPLRDGRVRFVIFDRDHPLVTVGIAAGGAEDGEVLQTHIFDTRTGHAVEPHAEDAGFMDVMLRLHTDMYAGQPGLYFLGAMGALLAISIVSGVLLYGPFMRKHAFGSVRTKRARRLYWLDIHNLLGIVTVTWAMVVGLTGAINTLEKPVGAFWRANSLTPALQEHANPTPPHALARIQDVITSAEHAAPDMEVISLLFPGQALAGPGNFLAVMSGTEALTARLFKTALLDGETGRLLELIEMPWYVQALYLSQPLHFGDYGGLPLKIIWALLDLATIVVLCSGLYLWCTRRRHKAGMPPRHAAERHSAA